MKDILFNLIADKNLEKYQFFKEFCIYKEKGLRKNAFKSLNLFIKETKSWDEDKKKKFVNWLFEWFEKSENIHYVLVYPLVENLLKPILNDLMTEDSKDPQPFRWSGLFLKTENRFKHLEMALEIGGKSEQRVLLEIINFYLYSLWYSFHHIAEDLYLGDISENKEELLKIENLCNKVEDTKKKESIFENVTYYKNLLNDWIVFKSQGKEEFVKWCAENGKVYNWTNSYYY